MTFGARFGLTDSPSPASSSTAIARSPGYPSREETEPAACARADHQYERQGPLPRSTGTSSRVQGQREGHTSLSVTSPHHSRLPRKPIPLPPDDNRFADSEAPTTGLASLAGLHVVEIMEDFSYHLFCLTTRIPFRILFGQCKRLIANYSTRDDVVKLFNAISYRIEQTGVALKFWLPEDVRQTDQSSNNLISMFNVLKSMIQKSFENLGSVQQFLRRQETEHYTTIWQLKEDFAQMIRSFWRENSTEPAYVMFAFDLHQKLSYLNVKWTLGLRIRLNQDPNVRNRGVEVKDAQDMLDLTHNIPEVFSPLFLDAVKVIRAYFRKELQQSLTEKEHLEHLSLVQWLIDNAKANVVRPTTNEVRSINVGYASDFENALKSLESHGLQPTGAVYDAARGSSLIIEEGDSELQLALEISKQETSVQGSDLEEQTRYALALSANENATQPAPSRDAVSASENPTQLEPSRVGSAADRRISSSDYDKYAMATLNSSLLPSDVFVQIDKDKTFDDDHHQRNRSHEPQRQREQLLREKQGSREVDVDSGMGESSSAQQMTNQMEMPVSPRTHTTGQMNLGTPGPTQTFNLARDAVRDVAAENAVHSPPFMESKKTDDEDSECGSNSDSDSGDSRISLDEEQQQQSDSKEQQQQPPNSVLKHEPINRVDATTSSHSLAARHPSNPSASAVGLETDMRLASQILQLIKEDKYAEVSRLLKDLQGNVQQKLNLRSLGQGFLLEIVGKHATIDELAQTVRNFVQTGRMERRTLVTICHKLQIDVSNQSKEELEHLICMRESQQ
jgi:hypothetical protein